MHCAQMKNCEHHQCLIKGLYLTYVIYSNPISTLIPDSSHNSFGIYAVILHKDLRSHENVFVRFSIWRQAALYIVTFRLIGWMPWQTGMLWKEDHLSMHCRALKQGIKPQSSAGHCTVVVKWTQPPHVEMWTENVYQCVAELFFSVCLWQAWQG